MTKLTDLRPCCSRPRRRATVAASCRYRPASRRPWRASPSRSARWWRKGLAEEREVTDASLIHRNDGDLRFGLFINVAGKQAIEVEEPLTGSVEVVAPGLDTDSSAAAEPTPVAKPARETKVAAVLALLGREGSATLAELIAATGWLPQPTRPALTGLRKKGHVLDKRKPKRDWATCYRVVAA